MAKNKTFTLSTEDLRDLQFRQRIINEHKLVVSILEQGLDIFIDFSLKPKLSIKPNQAVQIDYETGKLTVIDIKSDKKK